MHLNDLNLFDLTNFEQTGVIHCVKIDLTQNVPDTRWGHSAVVDGSKLYVLGGRNDHDINDVHSFNLETMTWKSLDVSDQNAPKARRRHSCVIIGSSIIMFGGFDGEFFNDLHILPLEQIDSEQIEVEESILYQQIISSESLDGELILSKSEITFELLFDDSKVRVVANRALLLYISVIIEQYKNTSDIESLEDGDPASYGSLATDLEEFDIEYLISNDNCPHFLKACYYYKPGTVFHIDMKEMIFDGKLTPKRGKEVFEAFLEYLICGTFIKKYKLQ